jgi:hypothetical protein
MWRDGHLERAVSIQLSGTYGGGVLTLSQLVPFDGALLGCEVVAWGFYSSVNSTGITLQIDQKTAFNNVPALAQNYNPTWIPVGCPTENKVQVVGTVAAGSAPNVALQLAFYRKTPCACMEK